jgi:DNA repair protein RadC
MTKIDSDCETLWVAHVDDQLRCLHLSHHSGEESAVEFPLKAIVADVLKHGSTGLILAHNHPSGDARPSDSDLKSTRRLALVAETMNCILVDHLVFAGEACTSLRRLGVL